MTPATLDAARDAARFGGKAAALARALGAGLPVPGGWALDTTLVEAVAAGDRAASAAVDATIVAATAGDPGPAALYAVRSSAVGEDGADSSFAGQHLTRLGVAASGVVEAVRAVRKSVHAPAALAYRARRGIAGPPRAGVVVQRLIAADRAAVVFTRDPVTGHDVVVIEASHGLGETVVSGAVVPDRFVLHRDGRPLARTAGDKDVALMVRDGRVVEVPIAGDARQSLCLDDQQLASIHALVLAVDAVWPGPHDLEIAFAANRLYLLQRRPLTAMATAAAARPR